MMSAPETCAQCAYDREHGQITIHYHPSTTVEAISPARLSTEEFRRALGRAGWNMSLHDFCEALDWEIDAYSKDKFLDFQQLCRLLSQFDPTTLDTLVKAGEKLIATTEMREKAEQP
jgi:hypothetical protein